MKTSKSKERSGTSVDSTNGSTMVSRRSVQREYRRCDEKLTAGQYLSAYEQGILYGGRQAMGWVLRNNFAKPSACIAENSKP